jgi:pyruvyltransferase
MGSIPYLGSMMRGSQALRKTVKLYFYRYQNAGDMFAPWMMSLMFNVKALWSTQGESDIVAVGSILDHYSTTRKHPKVREDPLYVWGSGYLRTEPYIVPMIRPLNVLALRGPLTKERVEATVGHAIDCPLADPGLLASRLPGLPDVRQDIELGIIPHYQEKNSRFFVGFESRNPRSTILDIQMDPRSFLEQLRRCKTVLSTSLHGAVFADAFNIPNRWCVLNSREMWWDNKFYDYYGSFGLDMKPINLDEDPLPTPDEIRASYQIDRGDVERKQDALIECFPYKYGQ